MLLPFRSTTIAIVGRAITLKIEPSKKQRTYTKKDAKRINSDNFTRKVQYCYYNIGKWMMDGTIIISYFGGNNIFADCI